MIDWLTQTHQVEIPTWGIVYAIASVIIGVVFFTAIILRDGDWPDKNPFISFACIVLAMGGLALTWPLLIVTFAGDKCTKHWRNAYRMRRGRR